MSERVVTILKRIDSEGPSAWDSAKLSKFIKQQTSELSNVDRLDLVRSLIKRNIFLWLEYVSTELRDLASLEDAYIDFVSEVVNKVRMDLAQGPIIESLITIGVNNPQLGIDLSSAMRKRSDEASAIYSSFPLGGSGRTEFDRVKPILDDLWQSKSGMDKLVVLRTYRVIYDPKRSTEKAVPDWLFEFVESAASEKDSAVRQEAVNALLDFAEVDEERSMKTLTKLVGEDHAIRGTVLNRLRLKDGMSTKNIIALLRLMVDDEDDNVLGLIAQALAFKGSEFPKEAMEMILSIVSRGKYHKVHLLDYAAEQVSKADLNIAIKMTEELLRKDQKNLRYVAPYFLVDISKSDYTVLADYVRAWLSDEKKLQEIALKTARELLGHAFENDNVPVADRVYDALVSYANVKGVDVARTIRGVPDRIAQCIELVLEIENERENLDYAEIEKNWQKFPLLREFLSDSWLRQNKSEDNKYHEILRDLAYLSRESDLEKLESTAPQDMKPQEVFLRSLRRRDLLWPRAMLDYLNEMVEVIKGLRNTGSLKDGLRADEQFDETFSELQITYSFAKAGYPIEIEPAVGAKKLDLEAALEDKPVLFEVIKPNLFRKLRYSASAIFIPNRARKLVYDEFKNHLAQVAEKIDKPIVIVIDIGRSEIDYNFVADYVYGTLQFTWWTDKKTGKVVAEGWTRAKDSLHDQAESGSENLDVISAIVCYKTVLGNEGKFHLQGMIFLNPTARNSLTDGQVSKIEKTLFSN